MLLLTLVKLLRPQQWYKNLLLFLGVIFAFQLFNYTLYPILFAGFFLMCLVSGLNYIINDIQDIEKDKTHPEKKFRPLPSGALSPKIAAAYAMALLIFSISIAFVINVSFALVLIFFFSFTQLYSFYLHKVVLVDVLAISVNYVLRALAGCLIINVRVSPWLIIGVFFTALLLALGKRKNELSLLREKAPLHKEVFKHYTQGLLDYGIIMTSTIVIITYTLYSIDSPVGDPRLLVSMPVATFLVMRYVFLLHAANPSTRKPHELVKDRPLLIGLAFWTLLIVYLLYFAPPTFFSW